MTMPTSLEVPGSSSEQEVVRRWSFKTVKRPQIKKREGPKGFSFIAGRKNNSRLNFDVLQRLSPIQNGIDMVQKTSRDMLLNFVKLEPSVHKKFFSEMLKDPGLDDRDLRDFPIEHFAVVLVAEAILKCGDDMKFFCTIEKNNLEGALEEIYSSVHWKKLGFSLYTKLYPTVVRDSKTNVCLQEFIDDDGPEWAEQILNIMTSPSWTMTWVQKIVRGQVSEEEYNEAMNMLFVKLHMLDPQSVIPAYHFLVNQRALPSCNLELATRNYLGGPLDCTPLIEHVRAAILKESLPVNVSKMSLDDIDIFCGVEVEEFIMTEVRNCGVWNGRRPDNQKRSTIQDRCLIM